MVDWVDHGAVLSVANVSWARDHAWAPDAYYHDGTYYLVRAAR